MLCWLAFALVSCAAVLDVYDFLHAAGAGRISRPSGSRGSGNSTIIRTRWISGFCNSLKNTLIITIFSLIGDLVSSTLVAYGFARFRFPYRDALFPDIAGDADATICRSSDSGVYRLHKIGWVNTFWPLIAPNYFGSAFFIFICRQFFLGIPQDLLDAAKIDGASEFRIFTQVMVPLAKPAIVVIAILSYQNSWNDFLGP